MFIFKLYLLHIILHKHLKMWLTWSRLSRKLRNQLIRSGKNVLLLELIFFLSYFKLYVTLCFLRLSLDLTFPLEPRATSTSLTEPSPPVSLHIPVYENIHLESSFNLSLLSRLGLGSFICLTLAYSAFAV